jgi:hypothetical protein
MDLLDMKRRRLRILLVAAVTLGVGAASLSGALAAQAMLAPDLTAAPRF